MKTILIKIINLYQKFLSPDHSIYFKKYYPQWYCRYYPTCSEYTKLSIQKYGATKWSIKWFYRILRCNPCSKGWKDLP
jgi:hypothetical protein